MLQDEMADRKGAGEELRKSDRRLNDIIDGSPIPQFFIDRGHKVIYWNKAVEKYSGIKARDVIGTNQHWRAFYSYERPCLADFLVDGREDEIQEWYRGKYSESRLVEGAFEAVDFFPMLGENGMWLHFTAKAIKDSKGNIVGAMETLEDITDRKRAEEALRESEEKFRVLAETSPGAIFLYQGEQFIYVNPSTERLTRYTKEELLAMKFWDWIHPDFRAQVRECGLSRLRGEPAPSQYEFKFVRKSGEERWALLSAGLIEYRGKPCGIGTILDITVLKQAEEALDDAKNQAELYIDLMSHDINNMNHAAMGYLEMAIELLNLKGKEKELLDRPMELIKNSSRLIDNVKRIKRVKAGDFTFETIDIGPMLSEVIARYSFVPDRNVRIDYTPATGCYVLANKLLTHVFSNIVENAIKHSSGPLVVNVSLDPVLENSKAFYRVAIEDNGPGMPDEQKDLVFQDVVRDKARSRRIGLGLQLVKTLVGAFNGKVWVEDRVPGNYHQGCRFVVMLPATGK